MLEDAFPPVIILIPRRQLFVQMSVGRFIRKQTPEYANFHLTVNLMSLERDERRSVRKMCNTTHKVLPLSPQFFHI